MFLSLHNIKKIGVVFFILISTQVFSQNNTKAVVKESFESEKSLVKFTTNPESSLSISTKHKYFGDASLQWEWSGKSYFKTSNFKNLSEADSPLRYGTHFPNSPILIMSLYNESSQEEVIKISYEKEGVEQVWFNIYLNFTGWRTIWVPFYEMNGNPPKKNQPVDYDTFKISSVSENSKGKLFIDDIVFSQFQDDRHSYPDMIVPFIKRDLVMGADHWMPLIRDLKRVQQIEARPVSDLELNDLKIIENRINTQFIKSNKVKDNLAKAKDEFATLKLEEEETILGPPLVFKIEQVYFDEKDKNKNNFIEIQKFGKVLKKLAGYYLESNKVHKTEIATMFVKASKYFLDQGWQAGASGGTRHHIGYNVRELTDAFYIMKEPLQRAGILNEVGNSLKWIFNLGKVLGNEEEFHANIDYFNTQSFYHLMLIFMSDNDENKAALLAAYSKYISITLAQDNGIGVFKVDGTSWHHGGHYPAYGMGAFQNIPPVIYTLSGTQFRIQEAGHENFKKAFLTTRLYSQLIDYGFGNAGRHPLENNSIKSLKSQFLDMANAGNPENTSAIDTEVAAAYLRIWGAKDKLNTALFKGMHGITKETLPGYHVLPYAATSIHRRDNWAALIKGYSKYVWASEIYVASNRYGRYPANGTVQLLNKKGEKASGFRQDGWDWNRYPGATIIYLPLKELEPDTPLIMFRSSETFAGAVQLGENGVFGMKLNEGKGSNAEGNIQNNGFPGKLKAKKSVFSFGNKLICIGTGISSIDTVNKVETNLFQNYLEDKSMPVFSSVSKKGAKFPFEASIPTTDVSKKWVIDALQNGYHILSPTTVEIRKKVQESYHNKYSINTGKMNPKGKGVTVTEGNYAASWLSHGIAPKNASYQYVIYPFLDKVGVKSFNKTIKKDTSYKILRADTTAHIVKDIKTNTTGYVIFETDSELNSGVLKAVSQPSLLMIKESETGITLSAVQPDLNFKEDEDKTKRGYSYPVDLTVLLEGKWILAANSSIKSVRYFEGNTVLTLECRHGFSNEIKLTKN